MLRKEMLVIVRESLNKVKEEEAFNFSYKTSEERIQTKGEKIK